LQSLGDFIGAVAQCRLIFITAVVAVEAGDVSNGCLALNLDVCFKVIHVEGGPRGIFHSPDNDTGDLDRIAALVVHLELLAVEVSYASEIFAPKVR
jgi:hypothetical protein